jgi:hypothetical protein
MTIREMASMGGKAHAEKIRSGEIKPSGVGVAKRTKCPRCQELCDSARLARVHKCPARAPRTPVS